MPEDITIEEALELCEDDAYAEHSHLTARTYAGGLRRFREFLEHEGIKTTSPLSEITIETFIRAPTWLARNFRKKTAKTYLYAFKFFLDWLVIANYLQPNYRDTLRYEMSARKVTKMKSKNLERFPTEKQVEDIRKAARAMVHHEPPIPERNIALVEFLISTGCRAGEACSLKIEDIDKKIRSAKVIGKNKRERRVYISRQAREALKHYWGVRGFAEPGDPVFTRHDRGAGKGDNFKKQAISVRTADNIVKEMAELAGIDEFTPHFFRHAFGIKVLKETGNLAITQDLLGHASPTTTRIYAKITQEELEEAHNRIWNN